MEQKKLSSGQFGILTFVMMMAPLIHAVPTRIVHTGRGAWLLPILAVLPLTFLLWALFHCLRRMAEGSGLGDVYHLAFGSRWGKLCCGLSAAWAVMLMVVNLRFYAERYVSAVYPETGMLLFYLVMSLFQIWIVKDSFEKLLRAGKFFFWVVLITLAVVIIFTAGKIKLYNIWPVTDSNWKDAGLGALRLSTAVGMVIPAGFLLGKVDWKGKRKELVWWMLALTMIMIVVSVNVLGVFGPELTRRLQIPFFTLAKEVSITGAAERLESIITAMWMITDTALLGVLIYAGEQALCQTVGGFKRPELLRVVLAVIVVPLCCLLPQSSFDMDKGYQMFGMPVNVMLGYLLPGVALAVAKLRKKW